MKWIIQKIINYFYRRQVNKKIKDMIYDELISDYEVDDETKN